MPKVGARFRITIDRRGFLARAVQNELKRLRLRAALDAARGAMAGTPGWRSGDDIIRFVDELRSDDRDPWTAGGTPLNAGELPSGYDRA